MANTARIKGFTQLQRAFALADPALKRRFRSTLRDVAEPVKSTSESLASERIRNMTEQWSRMRVGVTTTVVYVAPASRRRGSGKRRRRNLYDLMLGRSLEPALDQNSPRTIAEVERMLDGLANDWERV